ncbi:D-amino-acid oxidase protein [Dioscorea alata]|uniref:D-amino-acid oxidase protein n=5 Tax=Dioscorea alata TaxID=55571 RepID=A0ACB7UL46_DIOAL|nr:D-amino-acid oxidase protein [Dioscorea alata]KAH7661211.1 D-amino-acid oxidase protein [Dioscorea alata]KAH7661212.1 D-amino-acid oxidase protein [Dioscorea alata]KAH7661213.1 D-amino-acid oxidase protein [Dioscorea alata]KAH7661214.1 D-amino-acid oxidase protein [Dioscorea alata]
MLALGSWSSRSLILSSLFDISGLKAHSIIVRPHEPDSITPHALFLSYQDSPTAPTLNPEVYPRPTDPGKVGQDLTAESTSTVDQH